MKPEYDYRFKSREPFVVSYSNIPYIYNGSVGSLIRGSSPFALFILDEQGKQKTLENTVDYVFSDEECYKEMSFTSKQTIEDRLAKTQNFFDEHFKFFVDVDFVDLTKLFVFTAFLDQLATDCFHYIRFNKPTLSNYIAAFKNIELFAECKGLSKDLIRKYKSELLDLLSHYKPDEYCAILFSAA